MRFNIEDDGHARAPMGVPDRWSEAVDARRLDEPYVVVERGSRRPAGRRPGLDSADRFEFTLQRRADRMCPLRDCLRLVQVQRRVEAGTVEEDGVPAGVEAGVDQGQLVAVVELQVGRRAQLSPQGQKGGRQRGRPPLPAVTAAAWTITGERRSAAARRTPSIVVTSRMLNAGMA
jgi:hypothetical protein